MHYMSPSLVLIAQAILLLDGPKINLHYAINCVFTWLFVFLVIEYNF